MPPFLFTHLLSGSLPLGRIFKAWPFLLATFFLTITLLSPVPARAETGGQPDGPLRVPILLYHRFGPVVADSMTITTAVFESHLAYLKEHGYTIIPLRELVAYLRGQGPAPPPKAVVIVADDGHESVYRYMLPMVEKYHVPVTLFIYPSAISNAAYALTWEQLRELQKTGLFDFQSHSYWHPNFKQDALRMAPAEFAQSVDMQLRKSKSKLEKELGGSINMLAWPFGIYDDYLLGKARAAGYVAAFTIEGRHVTSGDNLMKLPRYLLNNADRGNAFARLVAGEAQARPRGY